MSPCRSRAGPPPLTLSSGLSRHRAVAIPVTESSSVWVKPVLKPLIGVPPVPSDLVADTPVANKEEAMPDPKAEGAIASHER